MSEDNFFQRLNFVIAFSCFFSKAEDQADIGKSKHSRLFKCYGIMLLRNFHQNLHSPIELD